FKFTQRGQVALAVEVAERGWSQENESLNAAPSVLAFTVSDTGIGIPIDKQSIIFEAFQQPDGSTNRKYGGAGFGLALCRELPRLLGGEINLASSPGRGSTFTLFLPQTYVPPRAPRKQSGDPAQAPPMAVETVKPLMETEATVLHTNGDAAVTPEPPSFV